MTTTTSYVNSLDDLPAQQIRRTVYAQRWLITEPLDVPEKPPPDPAKPLVVVAIPLRAEGSEIEAAWVTLGLASSREQAIERCREFGLEVLMDHRGPNAWAGDQGGVIRVAWVEGVGEAWVVTVRGKGR